MASPYSFVLTSLYTAFGDFYFSYLCILDNYILYIIDSPPCFFVWFLSFYIIIHDFCYPYYSLHCTLMCSLPCLSLSLTLSVMSSGMACLIIQAFPHSSFLLHYHRVYHGVFHYKNSSVCPLSLYPVSYACFIMLSVSSVIYTCHLFVLCFIIIMSLSPVFYVICHFLPCLLLLSFSYSVIAVCSCYCLLSSLLSKSLSYWYYLTVFYFHYHYVL